MPGIIGVVDLNGERVDQGLVAAMRNAILHRDWYHTDAYVNPRGSIAVSRVHLGVLDKEKQPFSARGGRVKLFIHGEISNDDIPDNDQAEHVYRLYEKHGLDFPSPLNGSFVIVIVDLDEDAVLVATDRIARAPSFYFTDGKAVYFGPEMKSLFVIPSLERKINPAGVSDFLSCGHFLRDHTFIHNLETLAGSTVLKISRQGIIRHKYWDIEIDETCNDQGLDYYRQNLANLLRLAIKRRRRALDNAGILLSGGYDSRAILGCVLEIKSPGELNTISWGTEEDIPNSDCLVAKRVAEKLGVNHRFYQRGADEVLQGFRDFILLGEGLTDDAASYEVYNRIRAQQNVNVLLRGDENFGWPDTFVHDEYTMLRGLGIQSLREIQVYRRILKPEPLVQLSQLNLDTISELSACCDFRELRHRRNFFYLTVLLKHYYGPLNYVKSFVTEPISPWLDYDILDFLNTLPARYIRDKYLEKQTVTWMFPEIFTEKAETGNGINWATTFRHHPDARRMAYQDLTETPGILDDLIEKDRLKRELDLFFASSTSQRPSRLKARFRTHSLGLLKRSRLATRLAHRSVYSVRRRSGQTQHHLPFERVILRLLILKNWGDVFLNMPVETTNR